MDGDNDEMKKEVIAPDVTKIYTLTALNINGSGDYTDIFTYALNQGKIGEANVAIGEIAVQRTFPEAKKKRFKGNGVYTYQSSGRAAQMKITYTNSSGKEDYSIVRETIDMYFNMELSGSYRLSSQTANGGAISSTGIFSFN